MQKFARKIVFKFFSLSLFPLCLLAVMVNQFKTAQKPEANKALLDGDNVRIHLRIISGTSIPDPKA